MTVKYTVTFTDRPNGKTRYRHALKMLGAETVRIVEEQVKDGTPGTVQPRKDNTPTSPEAKAVADLFKRRHDTEWADEEIAAFKKAVKTGLLTAETMKTVTDYYTRERKKPDNFCRTSVLTFCRHFGTELDKASTDKPRNGRTLEWQPSNVVKLPPQSEEEQERIRAEAKELAAAFRAKNGRGG